MSILSHNILFVLLFGGLIASADPLPLRLTSGKEVSGEFTRQLGGMYLATANGGRQFSWAEIDPMSLPAELRRSLQLRLEDELRRAQVLYDQDRVEDAAPVFLKVLQHRHYLSINAVSSPAFENLHRKARGWIVHQGTWMPFAQRQQQLGLVRYRDEWVTPERAKTAAAFHAAFAEARRRDDHATTILELLALIREHPGAPEVAEAEQLVTRLNAVLERRQAEREAQQRREVQKAAEQPRQVRVVERIIERDSTPPFQYHMPWSIGGYNTYHYRSRRHRENLHDQQPVVHGRDQGPPGATFKKTTDHFNTGYPFSPPVSVRLSGSRASDSNAGRSRSRNQRSHGHRTPGVNIRGDVGGVGVQIIRRDPVRIRF